MATIEPLNARKRKNGMFTILPSFVSSEGQNDDTFVARPRSRWPRINLEVVREVVVVALGLALVIWLFLGGSSDSSVQQQWGGRPLVHTPQAIIVPSVPGGSDREGLKKAPGDLHGVSETDMAVKSENPNMFLYTGAKPPSVVVVTVLDDIKYPRDYLNKIIENRVEYAQAHDYGVYIRLARDFKTLTEESSRAQLGWARAAISREVMSVYPKTSHFWFVDETAIIMNPLVDIEKEFFDPSHLESKMLRATRVVREYDYIQTLRNNKAQDIEIILTRDSIGVAPVSFLFKNTLMCRSMFEFWLDPLYRWYNKFAGDADALRHHVQWHTAFLNRLAVVSPKLLAAYAMPPQNDLQGELAYTDGDFAAYFDCDYSTEACKKQFQRYWNGRGRVKRTSQSNSVKVPRAEAAKEQNH